MLTKAVRHPGVGTTSPIKLLSARNLAHLGEICRLPEGHEGIAVVDDFHRLDLDVRVQLIDYLKRLADEEASSKLVIIGVPGSAQNLVRLASDVATRVDRFRLGQVHDDKIMEMITKGERALDG